MEIDKGIPQRGRTQKTRYNFAAVKPGDSTHVKTAAQRVRILSAFRYWVMNNKERRIRALAYATSEKVGEDDPRGAGYRVFFKARADVAEKAGEDKDVDI